MHQETVKNNSPFKMSSTWRIKIIVAIILTVIVAGVYANALKNDFTTWDDLAVYGDTLIRSPRWEAVKTIFTFHRASTYQPIRRVSFMLDYLFCQRNPLCYHFFNVLYYLFGLFFLYLFSEKLLSFLTSWNVQRRCLAALFSTIIFAVHPVHVEAVTWISGRKEVLLGWFFFAALYFYLLGRERGKHAFTMYVLSLLAFIFAVLSKPSAVVFPAILLLFEICYQPEHLKKFLVWLMPFILLSGIAVFILMTVMHQAGGIKPYRGGTFCTNFLVSFYIILYYIKLCIATINFSAAYTIWLPENPYSIWTIAAVLANLILFAWAIVKFKKRPLIPFLIFWFYIQLLPYANIIPISTILADRYVFLASFAYTLPVGLFFTWFMFIQNRRVTQEFFKVLAVAIFVLLTAGYSYMTIKQNRVWRNTRTLWMDAYEKYPHAPSAQHGAALVFMKMGQYEIAKSILKETVQIQPYDYLAHNNLGICYFHLKDYASALREYKKALYYDPHNVKAKINITMLLTVMKQYEAAEKIYTELLKINPANSNWHFRAAYNYYRWGKYDQALKELETCIKLTPQVMNPYETMAMIYYENLHQPAKAIQMLREGLKNAPKSKRISSVKKRLEIIQKNTGIQP